jgi:colanic acid/amylovoran biosynthesis glycosyltransferase
MKKQIVLFTERYPYEGGEQFLETEIVYLTQRFERVIVVPRFTEGSCRPTPSTATIVTSLADRSPRGAKKHIARLFQGIKSKSVYQEIFTRRLVTYHPVAVYRIASYWYTALTTYRWLDDYLKSQDINFAETVFYTYWLWGTSLGIGLLKATYPDLLLVSRAHGIDLYEEQSQPPYIPFRSHTLNGLNLLALISEHGQKHIHDGWPSSMVCMQVHRLGVNDPGFDASSSDDNVFRIVSCAMIIPLKRLGLLIQALQILARLHPQMAIEWHHIGGGPFYDEIKDLAETVLPSVKLYFHGQIANAEVLAFYRTHPVDVFVNVSASEGVPVSIMEAQSYAIPVVATAVGGVPEIVNSQNGILLESNPSPTQIAEALATIALNQSLAILKRRLSKQMWRFTYNASTNYNHFIDALMQL